MQCGEERHLRRLGNVFLEAEGPGLPRIRIRPTWCENGALGFTQLCCGLILQSSVRIRSPKKCVIIVDS